MSNAEKEMNITPKIPTFMLMQKSLLQLQSQYS